jgi:hypothetical protein
MGKVDLIGQMVVHMLVSLLIIIFMEKDIIYGLMVENMKEIGKIIKWMDMVILVGLMEGNKLQYLRRYVGGYINDKKEGYGEFFWPDGRLYKGNWKDGK